MAGIPIFGFIYRKAAIMVDRSSAQARATSVLSLKSAIREGMSIVLAPEGTFNMTHKPLKDFYDGAFRIAIETGTPIQPVIFPDLYDRLNYNSIFSFTPGRTRAVFLPELPVAGLTENDIQLLKEKAYSLMEDALIRYKASWIKHD
jgi:1-acyl-sn-glycerol-3-phosphate acyltransferase